MGWQDGAIVADDSGPASAPATSWQGGQEIDPSDLPYPAQGDYKPNGAQSATAWKMFKSGAFFPGNDAGTVALPAFAVPGRPAAPGSRIIDQSGVLRVAGDKDDGAPAHANAEQANPWVDAGRAIMNAPEHFLPDLAGQIGSTRQLIESAGNAATSWIGHQTGILPKGRSVDFHLLSPGVGALPNPVDPASLMAWAPTTAQLDEKQQQAFGGYYQPETLPGKMASTALRMVPQVMMGGEGALPEKLLQAGLGGVGSVGAGAVATATGHPEWAPLAEAVGGGVGGGVGSMTSAPSRADRVLTALARDMPDSTLQSMQDLRASGERVGVVPTVPESAQAVTGNNAPVWAKMQQRVENSPAGGEIMRPFMAGRQQASGDAIAGLLDRIAPPTDQPSTVGLSAQSAAGKAISQLEQQRTAAANPHYTAAGPVTVPHDEMSALLQSIESQISGDKTGILAKPLVTVRDQLTDQAATDAASQAQSGSAPQSVRDQVERAWAEQTGAPPPAATTPAASPSGRVPLLDIESLDRIKKAARETADNGVGRGSLTAEQAGALHGVANQLDGIMDRASPDYVTAKKTFADQSRTVVDPARAGPVGAIAGTNDPATQAGVLYPSNPLPGASDETVAAINALAAHDGQAPASLTRQHLERAWNAATASGRSGPNPYGAAQFASKVAGNAEQAKTLQAGVSAAAGPDVSHDLTDLAHAFLATGSRLPTIADETALAGLNMPHALNSTELGVGAGVAKEAFGSVGGAASALAAKGVSTGLNALNRWRVNSAAADLAHSMIGPADQTAQTIFDARAAQQAHQMALARALQLFTTAPHYQGGQ